MIFQKKTVEEIIPKASVEVKLQAYEKKETETLQALRTAPFGMWLEFLREDHAEEMNAGSSLIPWLP